MMARRIYQLSPDEVAKLVADYLRMTSPDTASEAVGLIYKAIEQHQTRQPNARKK